MNAKYPLSFERLGQSTGFVLYMVTLDDPNVDGKYLHIPSIGDRAYVQIGDVIMKQNIKQTIIYIQKPKNI